MEGSYSKREIDLMFKAVGQHNLDVQTNIDQMLKQILEQTTRHNGRMTKLELECAIQAKQIVELEKQDIIVKAELGKYVAIASVSIGLIATGVNLIFNFII